MRRQALVELMAVPYQQRVEATQKTERLMKQLRQPEIMREVLYQLGTDRRPRDGYDYIAPCEIFEGSPAEAYRRIKDCVDKI